MRASRRKLAAGILYLLDLEMGTTVTDIQQLGMECLYKEVLRREVDVSVSEVAPYTRRSGDIPSGPMHVATLIGGRGNHETCRFIT